MFAQVNLNELTLIDFVKKELSIRDPKQIEDIMDIFKSQVIYSIHEYHRLGPHITVIISSS